MTTLYLVYRIERATGQAEYWTGKGWTKDKSKAKKYKENDLPQMEGTNIVLAN